VDGGVQIVADLEGLEPGKHGFHIHENGDCSAPDAESAGGHFNPDGSPHGAPDNPASQRHVGDLGNVEADADGKAHYERTDQIISMEGDNSIVGKAVIVHAQSDDLQTQPTGGAGPRLACGVIQARE
jgi:Cu-Zn family superoxide dismutase